jgi:hypothetical protein
MPASPLVPSLTSMSSTLDDLITRLSGLAEGERALEHEDTVAALDEVERQLRSGSRRITRLLRDLERRS